MLTSVYSRIILYILIVLSVINGWWLAAVPLLVLGTWLFSLTWEWLAAGIVYDALFGMVPGTGAWGYTGTIVGIVAIIIARLLRTMLRSHDSMVV
jgi:hypothetical protein